MKKPEILSLVLLVLFIASLVYFIPQLKSYEKQLSSCEESLKSSEENLEEWLRVDAIVACEEDAWQIYSLDWDVECAALGLEDECSLSATLADKLDAQLDAAYDRCYSLKEE